MNKWLFKHGKIITMCRGLYITDRKVTCTYISQWTQYLLRFDELSYVHINFLSYFLDNLYNIICSWFINLYQYAGHISTIFFRIYLVSTTCTAIFKHCVVLPVCEWLIDYHGNLENKSQSVILWLTGDRIQIPSRLIKDDLLKKKYCWNYSS